MADEGHTPKKNTTNTTNSNLSYEVVADQKQLQQQFLLFQQFLQQQQSPQQQPPPQQPPQQFQSQPIRQPEAKEDEDEEDDNRSAPGTPKHNNVVCESSDLLDEIVAIKRIYEQQQQRIEDLFDRVVAFQPTAEDAQAYLVSNNKLSISSENASEDKKNEKIDKEVGFLPGNINLLKENSRKAIGRLIDVVRLKNSIAARKYQHKALIKGMRDMSVSKK
jgi:hypothetical protein